LPRPRDISARRREPSQIRANHEIDEWTAGGQSGHELARHFDARSPRRIPTACQTPPLMARRLKRLSHGDRAWCGGASVKVSFRNIPGDAFARDGTGKAILDGLCSTPSTKTHGARGPDPGSGWFTQISRKNLNKTMVGLGVSCVINNCVEQTPRKQTKPLAGWPFRQIPHNNEILNPRWWDLLLRSLSANAFPVFTHDGVVEKVIVEIECLRPSQDNHPCMLRRDIFAADGGDRTGILPRFLTARLGLIPQFSIFSAGSFSLCR